MEMRRLGASGLKVSSVGLGCNNFGWVIDAAETQRVVDAAIDAGVTLFDTADCYCQGESETLLGQALGKRRQDVVVATKFGLMMDRLEHRKGGSRRWIMQAVEASLRRLGTDYIDLYQYHRPDPDTPVEETLRALEDLVRQGKVRYLGCSNFSGWQIADADWTARAASLNCFVSAQNLYSLLARGVEDEVLPACERFGVGFLPYFPLASGLLSGKYRRGEALPEGARLAVGRMPAPTPLNEQAFDRIEPLEAWARERGHTLLDLAFAWLLARPAVSSVIAGATRPEQVAANAAAGGWRLSMEEAQEVSALARV